MFKEEDNNLESGYPIDKHPQYSILRKHIERSVQDLFLISLRNQNSDIFYVFEKEEQINAFLERMLKYWEKYEKYETCQEIVKLGKKLKRKWKTRESNPETAGEIRIKDIFRSTFDDERLL